MISWVVLEVSSFSFHPAEAHALRSFRICNVSMIATRTRDSAYYSSNTAVGNIRRSSHGLTSRVAIFPSSSGLIENGLKRNTIFEALRPSSSSTKTGEFCSVK